MSIEPIKGVSARATNRWRVRWRDDNGEEHSKRVPRKKDAEYLDGEIRRQKALGELTELDRGKETLEHFVEETWWPRYAEAQLADNTRTNQRTHWRVHLLPGLGHIPLRSLGNREIAAFMGGSRFRDLAPLTQRSILLTLQGILEQAVRWGHLRDNPMRSVRKPGRQRQRTVRPLPPHAVERVRAQLDRRSATIVSLIAYAGLRPAELRKLTWECIRERTIWIPEDVGKGGCSRTVGLARPLRSDLAEWRMSSGRPAGSDLVMANKFGAPWTHKAYNQWHGRTFAPAARRAGWDDPRAYDLRHSFVSLLIQSGMSILEVSRQAGHRPEECLRTYAHLFEELDPTQPVDVEEAIRVARAA